jgi:CBS domain containing-hemolysin-like protein
MSPSEHPIDIESKTAAPENINKRAYSWLARLMSKLGIRSSTTLREDLEDVLAQDESNGTAAFSPEERMFLRNILTLRETRVADVMVPRVDIDAVDDTTTIGDLLALFKQSGHSRMPVYREELDDPLGMVHIKDLMAFITEAAQPDPASATNGPASGSHELDMPRVDLSTTISGASLVRDVLFVPPSMPATALMEKMQVTRTQLALVIDEYGGTDGLVALEDIVETVVGDIEDEHDDDEEEMLISSADDVWVADARIDIEDIAGEIGHDFQTVEIADDIDTLGGLLFALIDRVPVTGELISTPEFPGFEFEVLDADPRRIKRLRIYRRKSGARGLAARRQKLPEERGPAKGTND